MMVTTISRDTLSKFTTMLTYEVNRYGYGISEVPRPDTGFYKFTLKSHDVEKPVALLEVWEDQITESIRTGELTTVVMERVKELLRPKFARAIGKSITIP